MAETATNVVVTKRNAFEVSRRSGKDDVERDSFDFRDLIYRPALLEFKPTLEPDWKAIHILDQRRQGACTGFGLAAVINDLTAIINLFNTEVVHPRGPWRTVDEVEYATLEWVDWSNHRRLLQPIGDIPPAELEQSYSQ